MANPNNIEDNFPITISDVPSTHELCHLVARTLKNIFSEFNNINDQLSTVKKALLTTNRALAQKRIRPTRVFTNANITPFIYKTKVDRVVKDNGLPDRGPHVKSDPRPQSLNPEPWVAQALSAATTKEPATALQTETRAIEPDDKVDLNMLPNPIERYLVNYSETSKSNLLCSETDEQLLLNTESPSNLLKKCDELLIHTHSDPSQPPTASSLNPTKQYMNEQIDYEVDLHVNRILDVDFNMPPKSKSWAQELLETESPKQVQNEQHTERMECTSTTLSTQQKGAILELSSPIQKASSIPTPQQAKGCVFFDTCNLLGQITNED
uniref:Uncharacterized protein n=1 Tax=Sphaerodactylus townsendi TaxID=933632 RepID=A0ACB8FTD0_9SAUR